MLCDSLIPFRLNRVLAGAHSRLLLLTTTCDGTVLPLVVIGLLSY